MNGERPLVGIDIGSSSVSVLVAGVEEDRLVVLGCGQARHDGARKGVIANLEEVAGAVRTAAEEAEAMSSTPVEGAVIGLGGCPIRGNRSRASVPVTGRGSTVSRDDVRRALAACAQVSIPPDYRVLDIIPGGFTLDGQDGIRDPMGMPGRRLDASAFVLYTSTTHADTVEQAVNRAAIEVQRMVYEPLAAAEAVVTADERELGCLLLDVGYASSEWVLFFEGGIVASGALPVGGRHFTSDLATMLKTTTAAAERSKVKVGVALDREGLDTQALEVPTLGGDGSQVQSAQFAAEVLHERARDLFIGVHRALVHDAFDRLPRAGVVLTGGGARLDGMEELAESIFGHRARIGRPRELAGLVEPVSTPEWAVAWGLARLQHHRSESALELMERGNGLLGWLRSTLEDFFSLGGGT